MYIKKLTIWLFMLLAMVSTACSDIRDIVGGGTQDLPSDGVVLTLKLPNFTKNTVATRAATEQQINSLCVLCYDAGDNYLGMSTISSANIKDKGDDTYDVKVKAVPGTATLHIVANTTITDNDAKDADGKNNLYNAARGGNPNLDAPVCWGSVKVEDLLNSKTKVWLFRQFAKASVTKDSKLTNFEITGFKLFNTATKGTIANTKLDTEVSLPSSVAYADEKDYSMGEHPFYETPAAGKAYMIIKAKYNKGPETYYKVAFQMDLLRNRHYQVKVTAVNHAGYSSEKEAKDNLPENGLSVEVVDDNPPIMKMIACKDYELGVCGKQTVLGNAEEATITFVTTKPEDSKYNDFSVVSHDPWITVPTDYKSKASYINLPTTAGPNSSTGRLYTIKLTLSKNYESYAHTGTVTITSGDLSLDVAITQKGYDYRTDPNRIVRIRDLENKSSDLNQDDYFSWIDSKQFQGIRPEENQGRVRNDGLHFFVGKNQVYYLIPYIDKDDMTCNDPRVTVKLDSEKKFWEVRLANNSDESSNVNNYNRWISNEAFTIITITNARTKITVTYPVYHVGLFAKLTTAYQLGNSKASGWYYYEMVDVKAKVTKTDGTTEVRTYHMLDRNLGATNNGYYSPATTALEGNKGAIGGYFKISVAENSNDAKNQNTVVDALAIGDFKVCDNMCLRGLIDNNNNLAIVEEKTHYGEVYNCLRINTEERDIPQIFIPMSGYYEGKTDEDAIYKDSNHANLWTSSRLAGYQGFSESSPEYGFWYLYLDAFGKSLNLSNYRFVSGSSGNNTKRYRAMPVRLAAEQK
ncbi:BACON domain-containing protein [uncultured Prevotella sp.]|uniref:BACON domain-containing protein n=1 Tax=uncultured Prevotella sp. TaxID=159272 RepID=UPI0027E318EB|nr:BACON domain-containing carbohydrate-binding protein [uncultured Prevotella sp.]